MKIQPPLNIILISIFFLAGLPAFAQMSITTLENLNLRESPNRQARSIAVLPAGTDVELVGYDESEYGSLYETLEGIRSTWYRVRTAGGVQGWCFGGYLAQLAVKDRVLTGFELLAGANSSYGELKIPGNRGITKIGDEVFSSESWRSMQADTLIIPPGVTVIGQKAFANSRITHIKFPATLTTIEKEAFYFSALSDVVIPGSVTVIGDSAFRQCRIASITLPEKIKTIGVAALASPNLREITIAGSAPVFTVENGVLFNKNKTELVCYPAQKEAESYELPETVRSLSAGAFYYLEKTPYIVLKNITVIPDKAFESAEGLVSVTIPESVKIIGKDAFSDCRIEQIALPSGLIEIQDNAFFACRGLKNVTLPGTVKVIGSNAFADCASAFTKLVIPNGVTVIHNWAFFGCKSITELDLNKVTTVEHNAFYGAENLRVLDLGRVITIGADAFSGCKSLVSLLIPSSVTTIDGGAFKGCTGLSSLKFAARTREIVLWGECFFECTSLTSVVFPSRVVFEWKYLYGLAQFGNCTSLEHVEVLPRNEPGTWHGFRSVFEGSPVEQQFRER
jgi:hypothetical protein